MALIRRKIKSDKHNLDFSIFLGFMENYFAYGWWGIMKQRGIMEHLHFKMSQGRTKGNSGLSCSMCLN